MDELKNNCLNCGNSKKKRWQDEQTVKQLVARLNRIEGQVRGIKRMIEEDAYCDDVLNQISSIQSALNGVAKGRPYLPNSWIPWRRFCQPKTFI
jgi:hypothetical protein